jgi:hypothetical protein
MARPTKNSCEYFPHDNNMRNHPKVKALRHKFANGYAIWSMFIEYLTGSDGNVFEYSDLQFELLSGDFEFSSKEIKEVIDYCVTLEMLFNDNGFIYSESLNINLAPVYKKRGLAKEQSSKQKRINGSFAKDSTVSTVVTVTETPQSTVVTGAEMPQSKVDKNILNKEEVVSKPLKRFIPPTIKEIDSYIKEKGYNVNAERFFYFYESNGWKVGKNKMISWKASVASWNTKDEKPSAYKKKEEQEKPSVAPAKDYHRFIDLIRSNPILNESRNMLLEFEYNNLKMGYDEIVSLLPKIASMEKRRGLYLELIDERDRIAYYKNKLNK